jgi:hypothetical protein
LLDATLDYAIKVAHWVYGNPYRLSIVNVPFVILTSGVLMPLSCQPNAIER